MAFTAKILSWHFCQLNIVGCLLKRRPTKGGGGVTGTPGPPLATPLVGNVKCVEYWRKTLYESSKIFIEHALHVARIQLRTQVYLIST